MTDDRGSNASSVILSFLLGGLAGAALATLFAPRSGREMREMIGDRLRESADKGREFKEKVSGRSREMVDEAAEYVKHAKQDVERHKDRLSSAIEAGRQAYREEKQKS
jgi:gas vesicle protein